LYWYCPLCPSQSRWGRFRYHRSARSKDEKYCNPVGCRFFVWVDWNLRFKLCHSPSDIFFPWNKGFSRRHLIYLSLASIPRFLSVGNRTRSWWTAHLRFIPLYIPAMRHQDLRQLPESIVYRDQKSGFMTASAGQASPLRLSQASAVVAAGPLEVSASSRFRRACMVPVRAIIATKSIAGDGIRAGWLAKC
jgi:hypothetical protein